MKQRKVTIDFLSGDFFAEILEQPACAVLPPWPNGSAVELNFGPLTANEAKVVAAIYRLREEFRLFKEQVSLGNITKPNLVDMKKGYLEPQRKTMALMSFLLGMLLLRLEIFEQHFVLAFDGDQIIKPIDIPKETLVLGCDIFSMASKFLGEQRMFF